MRFVFTGAGAAIGFRVLRRLPMSNSLTKHTSAASSGQWNFSNGTLACRELRSWRVNGASPLLVDRRETLALCAERLIHAARGFGNLLERRFVEVRLHELAVFVFHELGSAVFTRHRDEFASGAADTDGENLHAVRRAASCAALMPSPPRSSPSVMRTRIFSAAERVLKTASDS